VISKPDVIETIQGEGIPLRQRGSSFWALCPFHSEKTPSFKVDPEKQLYFCFGCGAHGDVIDFVMKYKRLDFKAACGFLKIGRTCPSRDKQKIKLKKYKRALIQEFNEWCRAYFNDLADSYRTLQEVKLMCRTVEDVEGISGFYHDENTWLQHIEILSGRDERAKFELFSRGNLEVKNGKI